jgi:hypothetical protein
MQEKMQVVPNRNEDDVVHGGCKWAKSYSRRTETRV